VTIFDYGVIIILASSVVVSLMRGLVREILSLASWVVAFIVANAYGAELAKMLPAAIPGEVVRTIVAFITLFIGVRIVMGLFSMALGAIISAAGLGIVDRGLGAVFGFARGIIFVLAAVIVCGMTDVPQQAYWKDAMLSPLAERAVRIVKPMLPESLARHVHF
jgi:membrane protein required for colicin V production